MGKFSKYWMSVKEAFRNSLGPTWSRTETIVPHYEEPVCTTDSTHHIIYVEPQHDSEQTQTICYPYIQPEDRA